MRSEAPICLRQRSCSGDLAIFLIACRQTNFILSNLGLRVALTRVPSSCALILLTQLAFLVQFLNAAEHSQLMAAEQLCCFISQRIKSPSLGYCSTTLSQLLSSLRTSLIILLVLATTSSSKNSSSILSVRLKLSSLLRNSFTPMSLLRQLVVQRIAYLNEFLNPFYGSTEELSLGRGQEMIRSQRSYQN